VANSVARPIKAGSEKIRKRVPDESHVRQDVVAEIADAHARPAKVQFSWHTHWNEASCVVQYNRLGIGNWPTYRKVVRDGIAHREVNAADRRLGRTIKIDNRNSGAELTERPDRCCNGLFPA
jgi:hypothetical protein